MVSFSRCSATSAWLAISIRYCTSNGPEGKFASAGPKSCSMANCGCGTFAFGPPGPDDDAHAARRSAAARTGNILAFIGIVTSIMHQDWHHLLFLHWEVPPLDRKSTRLNSSHRCISY